YAVSDRTTTTSGVITFSPDATVTNIGRTLIAGDGGAGGNLTFNNGAALTPTTLVLVSGTLTGSADITVSGLTQWWAGTMAGTGTTTANGGIEFGGVGVTLGRRLNNAGTATETGAFAVLSLDYGGIFNNLPGALFDIRDDRGFSGTGMFNNQAGATLRRSAGAGTAVISAAFSNSGTVDVQTGTLTLTGGGIHTGTFTTGADAMLQFGFGTYSFQAPSSIMAANVVFSSSAATVNGTYTVSNRTMVLA